MNTTPRFNRYCNEFLLPHETVFRRGHDGDYKFAITENVPGDSGGLTKFGIDQTSHPGTNIAALTVDAARDIYFLEDWVAIGAEHMPPGYGEVLADIHINGGDPSKELQSALNIILPANKQLTVDGIIGVQTMQAMLDEGKAGLLEFLHVREDHYRELAQKPRLAKFLDGWLTRNRDLKTFALSVMA